MKLLKRVVAVCPVVLFFALLWIRQAPLIGAVAAPFSEAVIQANQGSWGNNLADLNGDGFLDVLEGGGDLGGNVYWYLYPTWQRFQIGADGGGDDLQVADINHDGAPDVVVNGSSKIVWYENPRGTGGNVQALWTKHVVDATTRSHDIVVADLNRDGKLDIVIRVEEGATFYYLQGATPDTWTRILINQAPNGHGGLEVADINRDGRPDIVENGFWLEGPANYAVDTWIRHDIVPWTFGSSAVVYDINHDGRLDIFLAVSESGPGSLAWFEAPVDPINGTWIRHNIDTVEDVHRFYLIDVNKDGTEDLVFAEMHQSATKRVGVYYNNGLGASWTLQVLSTQGSHNIAVGDVSNDGDIDIIGANWNTSAPDGGAMKIWRNDLDNAIPVNQWTYIEADNTRSQNNTFGLTAGDINKDGWPDILSGQYWYRNPQGNLAGPWTRTGIGPYDGLFLMDVDDDGNMDILGQAMINSTTVGFYRLTPSANFSSWTPLLVGTTPPTHPVNPDHWSSHGFRLAQIVPGGKPEIVLTSEKSIYYFQVPANPALGNWPRVEITNTLWGQSDVEMSDVDGDGDADALGFYAPQNLAWWENPGNGSALWVRHDIGTTPDQMGGRVAVGDFNGDGRKDVVVSEANFSTSGNGVYWFECPSNALTPSWTRRTVLTNLGSIHSVEVGDYDQNGTPDILTGTHRGTLQAMIMRTADHGVTWTTTIVNTGFEAHIALRTFDLDRDGDLDIISDAWDHYQFLYMWRNNALGGAAVDTTPPQISQVTSSQVSAMSAQVNWATNEPADSTVEYGPDSNYGTAVTLIPLVAGHTVTLTGLTPSTQHHYRVTSKDASANLTTSGDFTFTTGAPDGTPPQITNASVNPLSPTSATINWTTDEPADGRVEYGADATYGFSTPLQTALVTGHTIVIGGLVANTTYHFRINTKDSSANLAQSLDDMFTTPIPDTTLPTVAISAPTGGSVVGTIGVTASANDNVGVMGVQFFLDGAMLGAEATTSPFSTSWNTTLVANGTHTLTAVARDAAGNSKTSDPVMVTVANVILFAHRQSVGATNDGSSNTISLPFALPTLAGDLIVAAVSMGNNVSVTCSDSQNNTYTSLPAQFDGSNNQGLVVCYAPNVKAGATTVTATLGGSATYRRLLIHEYSGLAQTNPVDVTAATIANGTTAANNISTTAGVTTGNALIFAAVMDDTGTTGIQAGTSFTLRGSVGGVDLATEDRLQTTAGSFAGTFTFGAAHRYLARMVAFKLGSVPDATLPDVTITAPAGGGTTVSGNVSLSATATDNIGVIGLQYKVDGANIGPEITNGIYNVTWDSTTVLNGTRVLTAVARDATGNSRTSTGVSVNVNNVDSTPPTFQNIQATAITLTGATITWTTNEPATSQVQYGTDTNYGSLTTLDNTTTLSHSQSLTGLTPGTTYFFRVLSSDAIGNPGMSAGSMFATSTPDTTPPNISGVGATLISMTGATIGWTTNEAASTQIQYGTDTDYAFSTTLNPALTTGHSQPLSGLTAGTTYFYRVLSSDGASNAASADSFFTTAPPDTTSPNISGVGATLISMTGATIGWTTNEAATTQIQYGTDTNYAFSTTLNPALTTGHAQPLSGLTPGTTYFYRVLSSDGAGNPASADSFFTTVAPDLTPPVLSSVTVTGITSSSATVTWITNEPGTTRVSYGLTTGYGSATPLDPSYALSHGQTISNLQAGTLYHFQALSSDAPGNPGTSGDLMFTTLAGEAGVPTVGLLSRWKLNEVSGTTAGDSAGASTGTLASFACTALNCNATSGWTTPGRFIGALNFDGADDIATVPQNATLNDLGSFTYSAWVLPRSLGEGSAGRIIDKSGTGYKRFRLNNATANSFYGEVRLGTTNAVATSAASTVTLNQWQHVVMTFDNTTKILRIYKNGVQIATATGAGNPQSEATGNFLIGNNAAGSATFNGLIDDVLVYNRALTPSEIQTLASGAPDLTSPQISGQNATGLTTTAATVVWNTDEASDTSVQYGLDTNYGTTTPVSPALVLAHSVPLSGLAPGTTYQARVLSRDSSGNLAQSANFSFSTVTPDTTPPTVSLSTPAAGTVTGTVSITASANDDVGVASLQYFLDGTTALSGLLSGSPYTFAWNTAATANGLHTLTAVAKDATGNSTTSAGVGVTVSNVVPLVGFVQSASSSSDSPGMTIPQAFNNPVTAGNLIVVAVSWGRDGTFTCSDSQGNVYSMLTATYDNTNDQSLGVCYAANAKAGATTVTATFTSSVKYRRLLVHEYFGIAKTNPLDVSVARTAAGTTAANNISSGSVTTTANGDLVFVAVMDDAGTTNTTAGTGFTLRATTASDLSSEDRVLPAVGAVTGTFTFSTAHRYIIRIVTFKAGS